MARWNPFGKKDENTEEAQESAGMFGFVKSALKKTVTALNTDIRDLVKEGRLVDDQFLDELFAHLVKNGYGRRTCRKNQRRHSEQIPGAKTLYGGSGRIRQRDDHRNYAARIK